MQFGKVDLGRQLYAVPACSGHTDFRQKMNKDCWCGETKREYTRENIRGKKTGMSHCFSLCSVCIFHNKKNILKLLEFTDSNDCPRLLCALPGLIPAVSAICWGRHAARQSVILSVQRKV